MTQEADRERFRIPKLSVPVLCHTVQHEKINGQIFLDVVESTLGILQHMLDFFNSSPPFFPIRVGESQNPVLLSKSAIARVDILQSIEDSEVEMLGMVSKKKEAILHMNELDTTRAYLVLDLPSSYSRILDLLNMRRPFLIAVIENSYVLLNSQHIYKIEEP